LFLLVESGFHGPMANYGHRAKYAMPQQALSPLKHQVKRKANRYGNVAVRPDHPICVISQLASRARALAEALLRSTYGKNARGDAEG
jgi:hypothetical protein